MAAAAAASPVPALLPIKAITPNSTVAEAFRLMPGCGALPVVDERAARGHVARSDVILLAANNTYRRVSLSEFTVGQALAAAAAHTPEAQAAAQAAAAAAAAAAAGCRCWARHFDSRAGDRKDARHDMHAGGARCGRWSRRCRCPA